MKKLTLLILLTVSVITIQSQTDQTEAIDFQVKAVSGETIKLFPILDEQNKIVVIDFFSTTCGPCQDYAPDFQNAYELFDFNNGNVFFMGINFNNDNDEVLEFDSIFGLTYPSVSGIQGGGDNVYEAYNIMAYPTVIVITPDHQIVEQSIWPPSEENIVNAVYAHGGVMVGNAEIKNENSGAKVFPNPASDKAILSINSANQTSINYSIYGQFGNSIFLSEKIFLQSGNNQLELPVKMLKSGIYFVRISGESFPAESIKFFVIN
ncbi:MAG TPA: redoxin domain-containing protein [Bacteroidales bacterium]